jgi:histone H3/H4
MDRSDYLPSSRLNELAQQIDPAIKLMPDAEQARRPARPAARSGRAPTAVRGAPPQVLQDVADDFVENLTVFACELAVHRGGSQLEARDIQLALEKNWNMRLLGVGDHVPELKQIKKTTVTEAHKNRLADVRRSKLLNHR